MAEPMLSAADMHRMRTPLWEQAKIALARGRPADAAALIDRAVTDWRSLQDHSVNWIASLLTFIGSELGEEAVERALRKAGDEYLRSRRTPPEGRPRWEELPASARAKVIARTMLSSFSEVEVEEDDDKVALSFRCGSGGRLVDEGRYEGPNAYLTLRERAPRTFGRDALPVYCTQCSVNNEMQAIEWGGVPTSVEHPPEQPGEPCVHHVYKDPWTVPAEVYERIGKELPEPRAAVPEPDT